MPINVYECMVLLNAKTVGDRLTNETIETVRTKLHSFLAKYNAEILAGRPWESKLLAYPIQGQKKGQYYLLFFKMESTKLPELENDFRLNPEFILRYLILNVHPKLVDELYAVAKDEKATALHAMTSDDGLGDELGLDDGNERRRRRQPVTAADGEGM